MVRGIGRLGSLASAALALGVGLLPQGRLTQVRAQSLSQTQTAVCNLVDGELRTVTRVVDGETLQVDGGGEIRLVGALAPRAYDVAAAVDAWPVAERTRLELERLVAGRSVIVAASGRRTDRYGRRLAHVFVAAEQGGEPLWVQGELLKRGLARAYAIDPAAQCMAELLAHEAIARDAAAGLWAEPAYLMRGAEEIGVLARHAGTFQVVEGKALRVSTVRGVVYVNFGEDQRQDFTVTIPERAARSMIALGVGPQLLAGRRIRVRGWIERRGGPFIAIQHGAEIEVLGGAEEAATETPAARPANRAEARRRNRSQSQAQ